jgi:hypothetical protein
MLGQLKFTANQMTALAGAAVFTAHHLGTNGDPARIDIAVEAILESGLDPAALDSLGSLIAGELRRGYEPDGDRAAQG